jgi:hypothetical protein
MKTILPDIILKIHKLFIERGKKLYVVGGSCRDFLMDVTPKDFDLCTDATPSESIDILKSNNITHDYHGEAFGVVVAYDSDNIGYEIATFRTDLSEGRHPEVSFNATIEDDAARRDITINSIYYSLDSNEFIDINNGKADIDNRIIKMVGCAKDRLREDKLRVLRAIRFKHRYDFLLDNSIVKAIEEDTEILTGISQERIWEEVIKSFKQVKHFDEYLISLQRLGLFKFVFPGFPADFTGKKWSKLEFYVADILKHVPTKSKDSVIQKCKIEGGMIGEAFFLRDFITKFTPEQVFDFFKEKERFHISDDTLRSLAKEYKFDTELTEKFIKFKPTVDGLEIAKKFKGKAISDEIKRLEFENFKLI